LLESIKKFNIRVYGLLVNNNGQVLVSAEFFGGKKFIKFPGGGLEFGEGIADCIKREFKEEADLSVEIKNHLYTTDFFVRSAFYPTDQLISIYYALTITNNVYPRFTEGYPELPAIENNENFGWVNIKSLTPDKFTFPIDKILVSKIMDKQIQL